MAMSPRPERDGNPDRADGSAKDDLLEAGRALEAFARTSGLVRTEIERLARTGEANLERLVRRLAMVLAEFAATSPARGSGGGPATTGPINLMMTVAGGAQDRGQDRGPASVNQIATLVAQAVRRGARFQ